LPEGRAFTTVATYHGIPETFTIPSLGGLETGAVRTEDGVIIWGEPEVAAAWYPVNDHPRDKASYSVDLTVPEGLEGISNGNLIGKSTAGGWTTWKWNETAPMASYLAVAAVGQFKIHRWTTDSGIPMIDAVDPQVGNVANHALSLQGDILDFLSSNFGPYPFDVSGALIEYGDLGAALEDQTRPLYDQNWFGAPYDEYVIVHELAHQWYGDNVAVNEWRHIWLNEGFATYAEWLWDTHTGLSTPRLNLRQVCSIPANSFFWDNPIGDPGVNLLFDGTVYVRGAATLQTLREQVGGPDFKQIMQTWASTRAGGTGTSEQFETLSEQISGQNLDELFNQWLFRPSKPDSCSGLATGRPSGPVHSLIRQLSHTTR
jgi:aminopeptidase N